MDKENAIANLSNKIAGLFELHGFNKELVNDEVNFVRDGKYRKATYIKGFDGFVIEYADSFEEAKKNRYEDGDCYPISLGNSLIYKLDEDIIKYMI